MKFQDSFGIKHQLKAMHVYIVLKYIDIKAAYGVTLNLNVENQQHYFAQLYIVIIQQNKRIT